MQLAVRTQGDRPEIRSKYFDSRYVYLLNAAKLETGEAGMTLSIEVADEGRDTIGQFEFV